MPFFFIFAVKFPILVITIYNRIATSLPFFGYTVKCAIAVIRIDCGVPIAVSQYFGFPIAIFFIVNTIARYGKTEFAFIIVGDEKGQAAFDKFVKSVSVAIFIVTFADFSAVGVEFGYKSVFFSVEVIACGADFPVVMVGCELAVSLAVFGGVFKIFVAVFVVFGYSSVFLAVEQCA